MIMLRLISFHLAREHNVTTVTNRVRKPFRGTSSRIRRKSNSYFTTLLRPFLFKVSIQFLLILLKTILPVCFSFTTQHIREWGSNHEDRITAHIFSWSSRTLHVVSSFKDAALKVRKMHNKSSSETCEAWIRNKAIVGWCFCNWNHLK